MAFIKRVIDHVLNQVLVESLANSRWFQRFAVWSHSKYKDLHAQAQDPNAVLDSTVKAAQAKKEGLDKWRQEFLDELRRLRETDQGSKRPPTSGGTS